MLHHTCEPTHPETTSQDTLQTSDPKLFISHIRVLNFAGTDYTSHVCQPWTNVAKIHHKTSDPKIFISHIPLLNFAGAALHIKPRMWANPSWTNVPRHTANFRSQNFHLTHPCFELCRNRLHLACVPTLNKCGKDTPQNLRPQDFHLTHPSFELCRSSSPYYTTHVCQPILNQPPKTHYKVQIRKFSSHTELCRSNSEQMTPRMCANPKTSDPKIFITQHTSLLNFAGAALHITPRMCANPSWTNVPRHTTNFRSENFHLTHPCFELCRNNSEQMTPRNTTHVCQPWTNVPKIHHKTSDPKT